MIRLKLMILLAFLVLLSGCGISNRHTLGKVSGSTGYRIVTSHTLSQPVGGVADGNFSNNPDVITIEHNTILYNYIGAIIEEVRLVNRGTTEIIASNIQPGSNVLAQWVTTEQNDFSNCESPYFILIVSGQEIPITNARIVDSEIHEELLFTFDEIAFFQTENHYYFSPQSDYLNREENHGECVVQVQYLYLPQVRRWLRQREGQLLFAVGLEEEEILEYFPKYTGDIPLVTRAAVISCETIYFEDVHVEIKEEYGTVLEIRKSDELETFTPEDVIVISVDHVRFPYLYFRYQDAQGNVHRQYVNDQQRDNNNGTIISHMLTMDDKYYKLVPVD